LSANISGELEVRPIKSLISLEEAVELCLQAATPIARTERVSLEHAAGRVLAEDLVAPFSVPSTSRSAMDGYAVRAEDTFGAGKFKPKVFKCIEVLYAGQMPTKKVGPGECAEIATGGVLPEGADAVVKVEDTDREGGQILVARPTFPKDNVRAPGEDIKEGGTALHAGDVLTPGRLGVLAALNQTTVHVFARPRVAVLSTGEEVAEPGKPLKPGQIYDINSLTLRAVIEANEGEVIPKRNVADTMEDILETLREALECDLVIYSGGSSVGTKDVLVDAFREMGEIVFHGVGIKPGRPTLLARIQEKPVLGMPGHPASCLSNAYIFVAPMLRKMAHLPAARPHTVRLPLDRRITSPLGRREIVTVKVEGGQARVVFKESSAITSMSEADGYFEIPANVDLVDKGELVEVTYL